MCPATSCTSELPTTANGTLAYKGKKNTPRHTVIISLLTQHTNVMIIVVRKDNNAKKKMAKEKWQASEELSHSPVTYVHARIEHGHLRIILRKSINVDVVPVNLFANLMEKKYTGEFQKSKNKKSKKFLHSKSNLRRLISKEK